MDKANKKEEEQTCDDCGAGKMLLDANKGELYCDACGITTPSKDIMDANAGKTTYGGESATHQAVRNDENVNANMGTKWQLHVDCRDERCQKEEVESSTERSKKGTCAFEAPTTGICPQEGGRDVRQVRHGSCRAVRQDDVQAAQRQSTRSNVKRSKTRTSSVASACPSRRFVARRPMFEAMAKEQRIVMMAMAAVEVAGDLGLLSKMDRRAGMEQYGIKRKQLLSAKRALLNHFKARITMGWEPKPPVKTPAERREDGVEQAVHHIHDMLSDVLSEQDHAKVTAESEARLALLEEGTADALTGNTEVRMAVCAVFYATLVSLGLQAGMADRLAAVFGMTGSGIRSRYEAFAAAEASGEVDYNGAFLLIAMTCFEILATLHPEHTLIEKAGLADAWNSEEGSSSS
jgi:hypothetical protein